MGNKEKIIETIEVLTENREEIIEKVWTSALIASSARNLLYVLLPGKVEERQSEANERGEIIKGIVAICELDGKEFRFFSNLDERRYQFSDNPKVAKVEIIGDDINKRDSEANEYILTELIDLLTRSEDVQLKKASLNYGGEEWDVLYEAEA